MKIGEDMFGNPVHVPLKHKGRPKVNPCIAVWGKGPEGTKCGTCQHHYCPFRGMGEKPPPLGGAFRLTIGKTAIFKNLKIILRKCLTIAK